MEEVIGEAVVHVAKHSPKRELAVSVPEELLLVPMDAKLIKQVMINLLDNAIKHTSPENEISIDAALNLENNMAVFSVKDRGTGIQKEDLPNIFKMFYTSSSKYANSRHGAGLGLAICETIIKAHGGDIVARNRNDGPGAEIRFTLPMEVQG